MGVTLKPRGVFLPLSARHPVGDEQILSVNCKSRAVRPASSRTPVSVRHRKIRDVDTELRAV